jgi:hypothetical protein
MTTIEIAKTLYRNTSAGNHALNYELFSPDAISYEDVSDPETRETKGLKNIMARCNKFIETVEKETVIAITEPLVAGNNIVYKLTIAFELKDKTSFTLEELCLYKVKDGKIVYEEYFNQ